MNEDERGITPPNVTVITMETGDEGWHVTIEQGNGDVVKTIELTSMERIKLGVLLLGDAVAPGRVHTKFVDVWRVSE